MRKGSKDQGLAGYVVFVTGVSGSGKTTVGKLLAGKTGVPFHDADDDHSEANVRKMRAGIPLDDTDRMPWLESLQHLAARLLEEGGGVIACSALKASYRKMLSVGIEDRCKWILLEGDYTLIRRRLDERPGHFMPASLLESQFATLEIPSNAMRISVNLQPDEIVNKILRRMNGSQIGIVGMGVMGRSLALNFAGKGFDLALFNRLVPGKEEKVAQAWIERHPMLKSAQGFEDLGGFVLSLTSPRTIILMVEAGKAVDDLLEHMTPLLSNGDVIVDCGNSFYLDTLRRAGALRSLGIHFLGSGVSGGEQGALSGPAVMTGGSREGYAQIGSALEAIAARDRDGNPCCGLLGPDGAGHFVKMVHNGIEYAEMQLIAEMYGILRHGYGLSPAEIADIFTQWTRDDHAGYLMEITVQILRRKEDQGWLIDGIAAIAHSKGTGAWTVQAADALGFPSPVIAASLHARYASAHDVPNTKPQSGDVSDELQPDLQILASALYLARIVNHHLGFELLRHASKTYGWELDLGEIARIWTNGCIIRSALMQRLRQVLPGSIFSDQHMAQEITTRHETLSYCITLGAHLHLALPCHAAALQYLNTILENNPVANLIQAQRDFFGAHGYERMHDNSGQKYHTDWSENKSENEN